MVVIAPMSPIAFNGAPPVSVLAVGAACRVEAGDDEEEKPPQAEARMHAAHLAVCILFPWPSVYLVDFVAGNVRVAGVLHHSYLTRYVFGGLSVAVFEEAAADYVCLISVSVPPPLDAVCGPVVRLDL